MTHKAVILGGGKMAYALSWAFRQKGVNVAQLGHKDFDALHPESLTEALHRHAPDIVCNTVVFGGIDQCFEDPVGAWKVNALFPLHVARLSTAMRFHFIHLSTESVFADADTNTFRYETDAALSPNMYGVTKHGADCLVPMHAERFHIFRLPLLFGPSPKRNQFFEKMLYIGKRDGRLRIADDIYSHAAFSLDVARFIVAEAPLLSSGLYHLSGAERCSLYELIKEAVTIMGWETDVSPVSADVFPEKDIKNRCVLLRSRSLAPLRSWRDALGEYCADWGEYLAHGEPLPAQALS